jgi:signal transduction histidine kinase/ligand-binding sensor domain-containing protein
LTSFCCGVFCVSGQVNYSFDQWQTENGLPYNSVTSIVQARDGYLWLGTYNGLARFDGVKFTVFNTSNTPELTSNRITSLFEDADGTLWIGDETGVLTAYSHGHFTHVVLGGGWPGEQIIGINADDSGAIWLLNNRGRLYSLKGKTEIVGGRNADTEYSIPSMARQGNGKLWFLRGAYLGSVEKGQLVPWPLDGQSEANNFQRACASPDGGLLLLGNGRIKKWTATNTFVDLGPAPWGQDSITCALEKKSGDLLVGTLNAGLFLLSTEGTHQQFTRQNGLSHDWIRCLCEDREGNVWVGTGGGGLAAMRVRSVEMVKVPDDWDGRSVLAVTAATDGGVWVGTEGAGLYRLKDGMTTKYGPANGINNTFVWSVLDNPESKTWVGTWGHGTYIREGETFEAAPGTDPTAAVTALFRGGDGALWMGTSLGLVRYENGNCTRFTRKDGLAMPDVRAIAQDSAGTIWFGMSGGGLGRLREGTLKQFRKQDGLPNDFVWSLRAEDDGTLWAGTFGGGLCRLKDGKFTTISTRDGLPDDVICHIADDGRGNFWISSYHGIFRIRKDDLRRCADGELKSVTCFLYAKGDGLSTLECAGGFQPAGCQTPDGKLWFPTSKGLAVIDPNKVKINPVPPPVLIEEIMVDGKRATMPQSDGLQPARLEIKPGSERFEFRYTALSLVAPDKVRFQYRLEGLEPDWVDGGTQRSAIYSYLKPGDYTFRVKACNNDGVWNDAGAILPLKVLPHFWQTWWFSIGAVLGGAGCVGGTARYITRRRLRQKMERLERQRALEKERARIAKDIHDDLGASLTRITLLSQSGRAELEDPHQAASDLDQIYHTARELTRAMDEIVWAVSPQHDTLDSLITYLGKFAQDFLSVANIRCRLDMPMQLPAWPVTAEVRHNLFLAVKEALHNVLKHASATTVRISLTVTDSSFALAINDNGKGFNPESAGANGSVERSFTPANGSVRIASGNGLMNMRKRLEEVGGIFELRSAPGEGTNVRFVVWLKS